MINIPIFGTFLYNILTQKKKIEKLYKEEYFYNKDLVTNSMIDTSYETSHSGNAASKYLFASMAGRYTTVNIKHCMKELNNSIFILIGDKTEEKGRICKALPGDPSFYRNRIYKRQ